jgi:hypothetical protein
MSQVVYRGNVAATSFPFLSDNAGRTVIVAGQDNVYVPQIGSPADLDKDRGIPQVIYGHNFIATGYGFKSIGYSQRIPGIGAGTITFTGVVRVRDANNPDCLLAVTANGFFYACEAGTYNWLSAYGSSVGANPSITTAYVNGTTYVYVSGVGCFKYVFGTHQLTSVTLTALTPSAVLGITGVAGYLIAYTLNTVVWSSTIDPTDFTPSLATGAGGGAVQGARGPITLCIAIQLGFIVYTSDNAVSALYTNNTRYPFTYKEIVNAGGVTNGSLVTYDANTGNHISYTSSGLQTVSNNQTQAFLPEVTDFISGKYFEDFTDATQVFTRTFLTGAMSKMVNTISDRYLLISYGITSFTHALVYDLTTKRFSKFKINHVATFEYPPTVVTNVEAPRESIGFLQADGTVYVADLATNTAANQGVLLLGKFQYVRSRTLTVEEIIIENVRTSATLNVYDGVSTDGKNPTFYAATLVATNGLSRNYKIRKTGVNHQLLLVGAFELNSFQIAFHIGGRR